MSAEIIINGVIVSRGPDFVVKGEKLLRSGLHQKGEIIFPPIDLNGYSDESDCFSFLKTHEGKAVNVHLVLAEEQPERKEYDQIKFEYFDETGKLVQRIYPIGG